MLAVVSHVSELLKRQRTCCAEELAMMSCVCCSESPSFTGLAASMLPCSPIRMYTSPAAPAACASPVPT